MSSLSNKIKEAFERRKPFLENLNVTNAFRVFGGRPEGIPGLTIDLLDKTLILNVYEEKSNLEEEELRTICKMFMEFYKASSSYLKRFVSSRSKKTLDEEMLSPKPFFGKESAPKFPILENGMSFEVHPYDGYSTGLFLDQRENRKTVGEIARNKRVLNLFSYTCGFSVACAKNGAETVSIDVSKKYLEWGKRNFLINGLSLDKQKFIVEDAPTYLKRLIKREEKFDVVIVDPPSFGRSAKGTFSIEKDYVPLLENSLELLREKGVLFASCNYQKWSETDFLELLNSTLEARDFSKLPLKVPEDFKKDENPVLASLIALT